MDCEGMLKQTHLCMHCYAGRDCTDCANCTHAVTLLNALNTLQASGYTAKAQAMQSCLEAFDGGGVVIPLMTRFVQGTQAAPPPFMLMATKADITSVGNNVSVCWVAFRLSQYAAGPATCVLFACCASPNSACMSCSQTA